MRKVKGIPIWVIVAVLVCIVAIAVAAYVFETVKFPVEVEEPLSVVSYPALLNFYPNTTEAFNITVENVASVNYLVSLAFSLNDTAYQQTYTTFSSETYTVVPGLNELTAWIYVGADAPPKDLELTVELNRVSEVKPSVIHLSSFHFEWLVSGPYIDTVVQFFDMRFDVFPTLTGADLRITVKSIGFKDGEEQPYYPWNLYVVFDTDGDGELWEAGELVAMMYHSNHTSPSYMTGDGIVRALVRRVSPWHFCYQVGNYTIWEINFHLSDTTDLWQDKLALKNDLIWFSDVDYYNGTVHFDPQHKLSTRWLP